MISSAARIGHQPIAVRLGLILAAGAVISSVAVGALDGAEDPVPGRSPVLTEAPPRAELEAGTERSHLRGARTARSVSRVAISPSFYGRGSAERIASSAPALRARVGREVIRVPPSRLSLRPRVVAARLSARDAGSAVAEVTVDDGDAPRYPLRFSVARGGEGWRATGLLND